MTGSAIRLSAKHHPCPPYSVRGMSSLLYFVLPVIEKLHPLLSMPRSPCAIRIAARPVEGMAERANACHSRAAAYLAGSNLVTTKPPSPFSAAKRTLSPACTLSSSEASFTRNTIVMGGMPRFLISLCLSVTF